MHMNGGNVMICYRKATLDDLEKIWDRHIAENPDEPRYLRWKREFISRNETNQAVTFVVIADDSPVGEVTLDFFASGYSGKRDRLADGKHTAYVTALRIRTEFEGQGHVSKLMQVMETYAANAGFSQLTIGVEAAETRNLGIYLHWGYDRFMMSEIDGGELVLFYAKAIPSPKL